MGRRRKGIPGLSFSWKRATGISSAKGRISRSIGVPLTKSGRQKKIGRATGCLIPAIFLIAGFGYSLYAVVHSLST